MGLRAALARWWRRNIIDDAPPYTDDEAERWKAYARRLRDDDEEVAGP